MKLIGRYDSPYVRRVGVSLNLLAIPFQLQPLSPFSQANELRRVASIGRMPALVLDNGDVLIESAAILDYLDEMSGPDRALLPDRGHERRKHLRILASSTAACDKAIAINYERRRPSNKIFDEWLNRCRARCRACRTGEIWGIRLAEPWSSDANRGHDSLHVRLRQAGRAGRASGGSIPEPGRH
jgi:glutathione S-transferase